MRSLALAAAIALCPALLLAQDFKPSANPVSDAVRSNLARESKNLVSSAELMPAERYNYHPTPAQMTFGQLIVHIVQTNAALCNAIGGGGMPPEKYSALVPQQLNDMKETAPKAALVTAISQSFAYCTEMMAKIDDTQIGEQVSMFGRPTGQSRAFTMVTIVADWADHYSTAAAYLRLNDILPPSAQKPAR